MQRSKFLLSLILIFIFCGCAALQQESLHKKAVGFMNIYNVQYADYLDVYSRRATLSGEQKAFLREKKRILTSLYTAISAFNLAIESDIDSVQAEADVLKFINLLTYGGT